MDRLLAGIPFNASNSTNGTVTYLNTTKAVVVDLDTSFYRSSLVLFIFGMGFFLPLVFCVYSMFIARRRRLNQIQGLINGRLRLMQQLLNGGQTRGLTSLERSLLPVVHYSCSAPDAPAPTLAAVKVKPIATEPDGSSQAAPPSGAGDGQTSCVICLVDYLAGDSVVVLTCHHKFHEECGFKWLEESTKCPLCKLDIAESLKETISALLPEMPESTLAATAGGGDGAEGAGGRVNNNTNHLPGASSPTPTLAVRTVP